ncbi:hypothetical protein [Streptomyces sp. NPDC001070]
MTKGVTMHISSRTADRSPDSDVHAKGKDTATWIAKAIIGIVTPHNVYDLPAAKQ